MVLWVSSTNLSNKNSYQSFLNSSKTEKKKEHSQIHFIRPESSWHKARQRHCKKTELKANILNRTVHFPGGTPVVKNLPDNAGDVRDEMQVRSLGLEHPLEEGRTTHSVTELRALR